MVSWACRHETLLLKTKGRDAVLDLTGAAQDFLARQKARDGLLTVSAQHSTTAITTLEFEPGLQKDLPELLQRLIPEGRYHHDDTWGDGNGHAHLRSALIGTSKSFPVKEGRLLLGTWQQIVFCDFDNRPRERHVDFMFIGNCQ